MLFPLLIVPSSSLTPAICLFVMSIPEDRNPKTVGSPWPSATDRPPHRCSCVRPLKHRCFVSCTSHRHSNFASNGPVAYGVDTAFPGLPKRFKHFPRPAPPISHCSTPSWDHGGGGKVKEVS
uniref:Putative secreted protein n=1 Tax=Anopheles darlingi TaxID=43151 RepID=A0A2M4DJ14_ANODA